MVIAFGGFAGDSASSQYLVELQAAKWNRFEHRIDEYTGKHYRTYLQYCAERNWTAADRQAYEWCYCTKNMLQPLDPIMLADFSSAKEYTWASARDILRQRVNTLAMQGDPYMRGARVAGINNANLPSIPVVNTVPAQTAFAVTTTTTAAALNGHKRKDAPAAPAADAAAAARKKARQAIDCKWGAKCARRGCGYRHPPGHSPRPIATTTAAVAGSATDAEVPVLPNALAPTSRCVLHFALKTNQHTNHDCRDRRHPRHTMPNSS